MVVITETSASTAPRFRHVTPSATMTLGVPGGALITSDASKTVREAPPRFYSIVYSAALLLSLGGGFVRLFYYFIISLLVLLLLLLLLFSLHTWGLV